MDERDERIITAMRQGRPVAAIAELEGLEPDYCRKATRRLAAEYGIEYTPDPQSTPPRLSDASRTFRNNMANVVYDYRNAPGRHQLEVSRDTGLTQAQQLLASQRGGQHDFRLSQLERLAASTGQDFTVMMLRNLLSAEQFEKVRRCLNI
ncbi:hypothetical protein [Sphingomonas jaspsi]|uniref:hypothetical protein n=1 Tax=Sphingomonas jaspsi TaxID=392409 RepID=UPI0012EC4883|nr:hypothetical protein [Sphingomonas jaspsi]